MEKNDLTIQEWHKKQAIENFNSTWDLIDKGDRTKNEELEMIHTAHASRFHWGKVGTPLHFARGEWQISRVYSILNMGESALYHGNESLKLCIDNSIEDFDLAFAYEALARGYKVLGNASECEEHCVKAFEASKSIKDEKDKEYFLLELNSLSVT